MGEKLLVLSTLATLLAIFPATQPAQASTQVPSTIESIDVGIFALLVDFDTTLAANGEDEYPFDYDSSMGSEIRYYLGDDDKTDGIGFTIKIYDSNNKEVAKGVTSKANNHQVLATFKPTSDGPYTARVVSSNGTGYLGYKITIRAF